MFKYVSIFSFLHIKKLTLINICKNEYNEFDTQLLRAYEE